MASERALIIIPTYNERDNLAAILQAIFTSVEAKVVGAQQEVREAGLRSVRVAGGTATAAEVVPAPAGDGADALAWHVLVVDDNSPDGTGQLADEIAAADPRVTVLHRAGKQGLGTAYVAGFREALARGYDYIFEMDADFSHDPRYLRPMVDRARAGADVVIGSRYVAGGGTVNWGVARKIISRGGGLYARTILGVRVRDLTAGFICWRRRVLEAIDLGTVQSNGYSFQIEMKYRAVRRGFRVEEHPIVFVDRRVGASKMSRRIFVEALTMVWRMRLGLTGRPRGSA